MPVRKVKEFLDAKGVKYITISHSVAYTTPEIAASAHIHGKQMIKIVMIKTDGSMAMAILPSTKMVNADAVKELAKAQKVELAGEQEFKDLFSECEIGAMPPFGNLFGMKVYMDEVLKKEKEISFNAGSHTELIKIAVEDFTRLVNPIIGKISF